MTQFHFAPSDTATNAARQMQCDAIALRVSNESSDRTKQTLEKHMRNARKISPASCAFLLAVSDAGVDFATVYNSTKQSEGSENLFNEKAIPKVWELAQALNGGAWDMPSIEGFTLHCVTVALASGVADNSGMQRIMHKLSVPRSANGAGYTGGTCSTQVSSSCRALEALGVIKSKGSRVWEIANPMLFAECARASGVDYTAPADSSPDAASAPTSDAEGIIIDGEVYPMPALPAPMAALPAPAPKAKRSKSSKSKSGK